VLAFQATHFYGFTTFYREHVMDSGIAQNKTLIIAEAGVNHNGSLRRALEMVDAAAEAGADVVKFQTFKAEEVVSRHAPKAEYQTKNTDHSESQLEMAIKLELDEEAHFTLMKRCAEKGIEFMSSPFDMRSLKFLAHDLQLKCIKIGSGELTNYPFLLAVARTGKKIILSSGMSTLDEIEAALGVIAYGYMCSDTPAGDLQDFRDAFNSAEGRRLLRDRVRLLHCTTDYPSDVADVNLKATDAMRDAFGLPVGLSDHTLGITVPIAAVALGASIIEKHFTLDKTLEGPDHAASLDTEQLADMVNSIRAVELALGDGIKRPTDTEKKNLAIVRRSLTAACSITKGEIFTPENMKTKRPGTGVSAVHYWEYLGKIAGRNYKEDELIDP
jgi:N-acetylneuraminate synthase